MTWKRVPAPRESAPRTCHIRPCLTDHVIHREATVKCHNSRITPNCESQGLTAAGPARCGFSGPGARGGQCWCFRESRPVCLRLSRLLLGKQPPSGWLVRSRNAVLTALGLRVRHRASSVNAVGGGAPPPGPDLSPQPHRQKRQPLCRPSRGPCTHAAPQPSGTASAPSQQPSSQLVYREGCEQSVTSGRNPGPRC